MADGLPKKWTIVTVIFKILSSLPSVILRASAKASGPIPSSPLGRIGRPVGSLPSASLPR
eukprot:4706276-Karenia_brevis.AAC.1